MYKAKLRIDDFITNGTLDMYVIKKVQSDLEDCDKKMKVYEIFKSISELDMHCICSLMLNSVIRCNEITENEYLEIYFRDRSDEEIKENFEYQMEYLSQLLKKCMPKIISKNEEVNEFEEIPDLKEINDDWDFPYMEFLWTNKLNRNDFWEITPKSYFEQIEVFKRVSGIKEDKEETEYL